jgi:hypothetical protein
MLLLLYLLKSYQKPFFLEYFDPSKQEQEQTMPAVTDTVRGPQIHLESAPHDPQPVLEMSF